MGDGRVTRRGWAGRERLPSRRPAETFNFRFGPDDARHHVTLGFYADGRPGEIFLHGAKVGSDADGLHADVGVLLSRLLQHGDTLEKIAAGMARLGDGRMPASIVGAALDRLVAGLKEQGQPL